MGGAAYQQEGAEIVDYNLFQLPGSDEWFRGPAFSGDSSERITFVGAAQTFGTFVRHPFPAILAERLPRPTLNLGIGGAGPGRFLNDKALIAAANDGICTVVQVMSGRSAENSEYEVLRGCSAMRRKNSQEPYQLAELLWKRIMQERTKAEVDRLVTETQQDWVAKMLRLLQSIRTPKVLLWISRRPLSKELGPLEEALQEFPHFVTEEMVATISCHADAFVDATSARGSPQVLSNRFTGMPTEVTRETGSFRFQSGYPSPEMHEDIANALFPVLRGLLPKPW